MKTVGRVALGAGVSGLVVWLGVRGSTWLKEELAYQRWRRQRFHTVVLPNPTAVPPEYLASSQALVWDDGTDKHRLDK